MSLYATCICGVPEGQEGAHRTDCAFYGVIPMSGPVCRGSWALGTACRRCERCLATKPLTCIDSAPPTSGEEMRLREAVRAFLRAHDDSARRPESAELEGIELDAIGDLRAALTEGADRHD